MLGTGTSSLGREVLQGRGAVGAGTPRLSGSRSDVHLAPPGGVRILASVRMLLSSLRPRGRGGGGVVVEGGALGAPGNDARPRLRVPRGRALISPFLQEIREKCFAGEGDQRQGEGYAGRRGWTRNPERSFGQRWSRTKTSPL